MINEIDKIKQKESFFKERINQLLIEGKGLYDITSDCKDIDDPMIDIPTDTIMKCKKWELSCFNLLRNYFGETHHFFKEFKDAINKTVIFYHPLHEKRTTVIPYSKFNIATALACLSYINEETNMGLILNAKSVYEASLFSNLLDQAFGLIEMNYLPAAAIYARLIIENKIKDTCILNKIDVPEKSKIADLLVRLREKQIIDLPTERVIQSKYDIGTYAAHGKEEFKKYGKKEILDLLEYTRDKILTL